MKDSIRKEHVFKHKINKVWNAISIGEEISTWFLKADFKAETGYEYTFHSSGEDCTKITGVVKVATPYTLIYTWIVENTNVETEVKWVLEEVKEGTKLYLEHSGISNYTQDTAVKMFSSFDGGWTHCIKELVSHLKDTIHAG